MSRLMGKWHMRHLAALAAAAFAALSFEGAGDGVSGEASGSVRESVIVRGGETNILTGTEADMAAVRALYFEEAASATASPVFPHAAPPLRDMLNPLAPLAVFDSDALRCGLVRRLVGIFWRSMECLGVQLILAEEVQDHGRILQNDNKYFLRANLCIVLLFTDV